MATTSKQNNVAFASVGIDIGKEIFHLVGFDFDGKIVLRRKIRRLALVSELEKLPPCIVGMEACLSAHFVSRTLRKLGHEPRIIPAIYVKPFIKGQKNDYNDAEAIAEAALRPNLKFVAEKTQDQLDLQALHRVRSPASQDLGLDISGAHTYVSRCIAPCTDYRGHFIDDGPCFCIRQSEFGRGFKCKLEIGFRTSLRYPSLQIARAFMLRHRVEIIGRRKPP